jgi:NADH-quinone oxidoreductase subunit H
VSGLLVLLSVAIFVAKVMFFLFFYMWIRWTLPRFRYDQLMSLGWKILLPMALVYIVVIATAVLILDSAGIARGFVYAAILFAINAVLLFLTFFLFDRGRIISPASRRAGLGEVERLRAITAARTQQLSPETGD